MYIHVHNHMSSKDMWKWKLLACNIRLAIGLSKFFYIVGVIARWILHKLKILYIKKFIIIHRPRLSYRQSPSPAAWATCSFWQLSPTRRGWRLYSGKGVNDGKECRPSTSEGTSWRGWEWFIDGSSSGSKQCQPPSSTKGISWMVWELFPDCSTSVPSSAQGTYS